MQILWLRSERQKSRTDVAAFTFPMYRQRANHAPLYPSMHVSVIGFPTVSKMCSWPPTNLSRAVDGSAPRRRGGHLVCVIVAAVIEGKGLRPFIHDFAGFVVDSEGFAVCARARALFF